MAYAIDYRNRGFAYSGKGSSSLLGSQKRLTLVVTMGFSMLSQLNVCLELRTGTGLEMRRAGNLYKLRACYVFRYQVSVARPVLAPSALNAVTKGKLP